MRAKFDEKAQKTRAELTGTDRRALAKAIEVLTNLRVCEQVAEDMISVANETTTRIARILAHYPVKVTETKAKAPPADK